MAPSGGCDRHGCPAGPSAGSAWWAPPRGLRVTYRASRKRAALRGGVGKQPASMIDLRDCMGSAGSTPELDVLSFWRKVCWCYGPRALLAVSVIPCHSCSQAMALPQRFRIYVGPSNNGRWMFLQEGKIQILFTVLFISSAKGNGKRKLNWRCRRGIADEQEAKDPARVVLTLELLTCHNSELSAFISMLLTAGRLAVCAVQRGLREAKK